jgi:hypothetical protein
MYTPFGVIGSIDPAHMGTNYPKMEIRWSNDRSLKSDCSQSISDF